MYDYLLGKIAYSKPPHATLDVQGIGYRLLLPLNAFAALAVGQTVKLYVSFWVRETTHQLFAFLTQTDRELFELLTTISGVGPKSALALLGALPAAELSQAIHGRDAATLARAPGIGRKTAERLIVDLADKLPHFATPTSPLRDAVSALINLGYSQANAAKAVEKVMRDNPDMTDLPTLITTALQHA